MGSTALGGLLKIAAVAVVSAGLGGAVYLVADRATSDEGDGDRQVVATWTLPTMTPAEATPTPPAPEGTPTATPPPRDAEGCPPGWQLFDNTLLHYTICYPPDWDLSVHLQPFAPDALPEEEMDSTIYLTGPGWFPLEPGTDIRNPPPDVKDRVESAPEIRIVPASPEAGFGVCTPTTPVQISGLSAHWCENTFDAEVEGAIDSRPEGKWHTVLIRIPLRNPEPPPSLVDSIVYRQGYIPGTDPYEAALSEIRTWSVGVHARSLRTLYAERVDLFWQIIRSIQVY